MNEPELITATREGQTTRVQDLISAGTDVNVQDEQGWTPLNWAAGRGTVALVDLFLENGADPTLTGRDNRTALMIAKAAGNTEVVQRLTEAEQEAGVWEDPRHSRPYCRAYHLRELRAYDDWEESGEGDAQDSAESLGEEDVVYLHQDYTVTRSMWHGEDVLWDEITEDWVTFCQDQLDFAIPEDLL